MTEMYAYTKTASGLLPAGYEVAKEQLKLGEGDFFARVPEASGNLEYRVDDGVLVFASGDVSGKIDLKKGVLSDYAIRGVRPFKKYPEPAFWRAPVDNDFGNKMPWTCGVWRTAHVNRYVKNATVGERTPEGLPVKVEWILTDIQVPYTMEFLVRNDGSLLVSGTMDMTGKKLPELPRFGMKTFVITDAGRRRIISTVGRLRSSAGMKTKWKTSITRMPARKRRGTRRTYVGFLCRTARGRKWKSRVCRNPLRFRPCTMLRKIWIRV